MSPIVAPCASQVALPQEVAHLLRELPKHVNHANDVGCDLRGLRLNILRLVCSFSTPSLQAQVAGYKCLGKLLAELHACANLSLAIDTTEPLLRAATEPTALYADPAKLERIFACALDAKPTDCLVLLELAARATSASATSPLPSVRGRRDQSGAI